MGLIDFGEAAAAAVAAVVFSALSRQAASEFQAWTPKLVECLISRAAARLPEDVRERLREEWASHVAETPGEIGKFVAAFGFSLAAFEVRERKPRRARALRKGDLNAREELEVYVRSKFGRARSERIMERLRANPELAALFDELDKLQRSVFELEARRKAIS